ncbi:MAG TPA: inositol monophosphatase family protein, partial [Gaiellaceae bacterium]
MELCRAAVADVEAVLERMPTRVTREPVVGAGLGGDDTTAIDQAAEEVILARIQEAAGAVVSEEVGRVGGKGLPLVVVDPIDGS